MQCILYPHGLYKYRIFLDHLCASTLFRLYNKILNAVNRIYASCMLRIESYELHVIIKDMHIRNIETKHLTSNFFLSYIQRMSPDF